MRFEQIIRFPPAVARWLFEPRLFWFASGVTAVLVIAAFVGAQSEVRIRCIGAASQLLGISTVAWGLRQARLLFEKPSLLALAKQWWKRRPRLKKRIITGTGHMTVPGMTVSATGHAFAQAGPGDTTEVRLSALEQNFRLANERLNRVEAEAKQELARVESLVHSESQRLAATAEHISQKLDTSWTGGLYISMVGLVWLALGTILAAFPTELAKLGP